MIPKPSIPLFLASLLPLIAQEEILPLSPDQDQLALEEKQNRDPRLRIPAGAVISNISLPYYNKEKQPVSLLSAQRLVLDLENEDLILGENLCLWLFEPDGSIRGSAKLPSAQYLTSKELLTANDTLVFRGQNDRFAIRSHGGIFSLKTSQAFFIGPAETSFTQPSKKIVKEKTAMNLKSLTPLLAALPILHAAPPPEITAEQLARFERLVAPRMIPNDNGIQNLERSDPANTQITKNLTNYLKKVDRPDLLAQLTPIDDQPDPDQELIDKLFEAEDGKILIQCTKGIYFDAESNELVYLGTVSLQGDGMTMTCKKDLKVIFENAPPKKSEKKEDEEPLKGFGNIGELKQFTASGDVRIKGKMNDKEFFLFGDRALYERINEQKSTVTLRGDRLAFAHDKARLRSFKPDAWVVVNIVNNTILNARFSDTGWQTQLELPQEKE